MADLHLFVLGDGSEVEFLVPGDEFLIIELERSLLIGMMKKARVVSSAIVKAAIDDIK